MTAYFLALDQGTSSSRAIIFTTTGTPVKSVQIDLKQYYPHDGWVEYDAAEIYTTIVTATQQVLKESQIAATAIIGIGITNQRETTVIWDRDTGIPIYPAISWQDRRTMAACELIRQASDVHIISQKTGLIIDPYFSATKIAWLLNHIPDARNKAEKGALAFGTIDTFLLWKLTAGKVHATDATNASRTMLFNIHTQSWDEALLKIFNVPATLLPEVKDSCADYGATIASLFGSPIPIRCLLGDQQAAMVGQTCFKPGMIKSTYGTGCFLILNTGEEPVQSHYQLLTTIAYRLNNKPTYALEGSIFNAGTTIQWLRDELKIIHSANDTEKIAKEVAGSNGVYFIPAFTGLGAPYWDPQARGALLGLKRDTTIAHIVCAALEATCYQTRDVLEAMVLDFVTPLTRLRVDGGMVVNEWLMQRLADIVGLAIERTQLSEITALGAAYFTGLQAGVYTSLEEITMLWQAQHTYTPRTSMQTQREQYQAWKEHVRRILYKTNFGIT